MLESIGFERILEDMHSLSSFHSQWALHNLMAINQAFQQILSQNCTLQSLNGFTIHSHPLAVHIFIAAVQQGGMGSCQLQLIDVTGISKTI